MSRPQNGEWVLLFPIMVVIGLWDGACWVARRLGALRRLVRPSGAVDGRARRGH